MATKHTNEKLLLAVEKRTEFGKKLKKMRHHGMIPANVFGPQFTSLAVTVALKDFTKVYKVAKETGVVYVQADGQEIPVLIKALQRHPLSDMILHVDFRKIDLTKKIETAVPVVFEGEAPAVALGGVLLTQSQELMVEALPADIPHEITVSLATLTEVGAEIKVQDLAAVSGYTFKEEPEKVIVSVVAHKEESVTPEIEAVAAPEVLTEKKAEGEEGAPAEAAPEKTEDKGKE
jgi:large subunit ribosomal protein L25